MAKMHDPLMQAIQNLEAYLKGTDWEMTSPTFSMYPVLMRDKWYNRCTIGLYQEIPNVEADTAND